MYSTIQMFPAMMLAHFNLVCLLKQCKKIIKISQQGMILNDACDSAINCDD